MPSYHGRNFLVLGVLLCTWLHVDVCGFLDLERQWNYKFHKLATETDYKQAILKDKAIRRQNRHPLSGLTGRDLGSYHVQHNGSSVWLPSDIAMSSPPSSRWYQSSEVGLRGRASHSTAQSGPEINAISAVFWSDSSLSGFLACSIPCPQTSRRLLVSLPQKQSSAEALIAFPILLHSPSNLTRCKLPAEFFPQTLVPSFSLDLGLF